jgi:hypothetical protein
MAHLLMGRFDIYRNPGKNKESIPYLVDVQSNVISGLSTRIVVPLRTLAKFSALDLPADLFPIIAVNGIAARYLGNEAGIHFGIGGVHRPQAKQPVTHTKDNVQLRHCGTEA